MNCRDFERELDVFLRGPLGAPRGSEARQGLESHAAVCASCAELLELARLPVAVVEEPGDFAAGVLGRTSGAACRQAQESLPELVDGLVPAGVGRELLAEHLEHCEPCSGLVFELRQLLRDLPRLAIVRPETSLVEGVLRKTLPVPVRLRRWWTATWLEWVRRPGFASELAYAATLVLVLIFGTPVSPLQAMPERAVEFVRTEPLGRFEAFQAATRHEITSKLLAAVDGGTQRAEGLAATTREGFGTILEEVASWFENAEDEQPAQANPTTEETS